jgi:hypothetical protein
MNILTMTFLGICTHFKNIVDGVPHRVVLPDATAIHFGEMRLDRPEGLGPWIDYYLVPHYPFLRPNPFDPETGYSLAGAHVVVQNAKVGPPLEYDKTYYDLIHSLTEFVPDYEPSSEVTAGRRAACHVDIYSGQISAVDPAPGVNAAGVIIKIETDGPPILSVTPLRARLFEPVDLTFHDPDPSITIANLEIDPGSDAPPFDYLLHYLTDRGGIPPFITTATPGMGEPRSMSREQIAGALRSLAEYVASTPAPAQLRIRDDISASCADSRYP